MILLHPFRTFPALLEQFSKLRNHTYIHSIRSQVIRSENPAMARIHENMIRLNERRVDRKPPPTSSRAYVSNSVFYLLLKISKKIADLL